MRRCPAPQDDPILVLLEDYPDGLTRDDISKKLHQAPSTIRNRLHDLTAVGMVVKVSAGRTDPQTRYKLPKYR